MKDIVERLRLSVTNGHEPTDEDAIDAADEIERLRKMLDECVREREDYNGKHQAVCLEIERLRTALRELADLPLERLDEVSMIVYRVLGEQSLVKERERDHTSRL